MERRVQYEVRLVVWANQLSRTRGTFDSSVAANNAFATFHSCRGQNRKAVVDAIAGQDTMNRGDDCKDYCPPKPLRLCI
jgi:hypothetical protein